ncbi:PPOX class F420-dependent oxidoreductase [Pseudonocardia acaciae]|uniref:PPOX class F420-dependent oxidoreductase n=1 Tax=Pseudonocardia acaciae TaxID=551276 RepID=UPI00048FF661|nr:PPOX class F420-dependent oxidoreductase [Pseudonocardia acaciae]
MAELSEDVVRFLGEGTRTGTLGWTAADGRPLATPVWFLVDGGELVFNTGVNTSKGRAIARDPRVVLCADEPSPPYAFVQVQGFATTSEDPAELLDTATRIAARYMGEERAEEFGRRNAVPGEMVVRVRPTKVVHGFDTTD